MTETQVVHSSFVCPDCTETVSGPFPAEVLWDAHRALCGRWWLREDEDDG